MKKSIFAVCDLEESYACNLTEYMNERKNAPFEVQAFTNLESLSSYAQEHHIELLLISTEAMCDAVRKLDVERIIILSDGEKVEEYEREACVYKYQSTDGLLAEVMNYYAESSPALQIIPEISSNTEIIGVYSPLGRVGKTSFALMLGEVLGSRQKVLYLNLEDYSGFETLFTEVYRSDLSDLIYFARQKEGNLIYKLNGMIKTFHNLDYIPPAFSPGDLREVHCEEWLKFIREIAVCGGYEVLILDMGNQIEEWFQILRQCSRIYMPILDDPVSRGKLLQFEKILSALEYEDIQEKIKKLQLPNWNEPENGEDRIEWLLHGELGYFVRRLAAEEQKVRNDTVRAKKYIFLGEDDNE